MIRPDLPAALSHVLDEWDFSARSWTSDDGSVEVRYVPRDDGWLWKLADGRSGFVPLAGGGAERIVSILEAQNPLPWEGP